MLEGDVKVVNVLGLHARAAAQLVRLAGKYRSRATLRRNDIDSSANAKSILSVLALAAPVGTVLRLEVEGEDAQDAYSAIAGMFENGFGEM